MAFNLLVSMSNTPMIRIALNQRLLVERPIACLFWLMIAMALLHALAEKVQITYSEDSPDVCRT